MIKEKEAKEKRTIRREMIGIKKKARIGIGREGCVLFFLIF